MALAATALSASLELGVDPPIRMGDDRLGRTERRRISIRWLAGAALTGLSGVTLIGAALYFDLDSQYDFAENAGICDQRGTHAIGGRRRQSRKGRPPAASGGHRLG